MVDTNVLLRLAQPFRQAPGQHLALAALESREGRLYTTFQNMAEFWNVSTRPVQQNGRGLSVAEAITNLRLIEQRFTLITEDPASYQRWLSLLTEYKVSGRQVHDARLIAHMLEHRIPYLLTSNVKDFTRYQQIRVLDPGYWS